MSVIASAVAIGRQVAAQYRPDTIAVSRASSTTSDGTGGQIEVPGTAFTTTGILTAGATRPTEAAEADRMGAAIPYFVRNIPYDVTILASDELIIGGRTFRVLGMLKAEAVNVVQTAVCEERL